MQWPDRQPKSLRAWRVCLNNMWAALTGDPHLTGAHGDHADVKGADGGIYSLLSAPRLSVAVRFEHDDFKTPYSKQLIHEAGCAPPSGWCGCARRTPPSSASRTGSRR